MNVGNLAGPIADHQAIQGIVELAASQALSFVIFMQLWASVDSMFYDITEAELNQPQIQIRP